ncbi:MAG: hypothetical protein JZU60_00400 [Ilumatobacteraceae bacterium]|jgi:hypothetical protein|nr:hypothetical protein [Ilumatobacteraceae bacterium]
MPWEYVGDCGSGQLPDDRAWIDFCLEAALHYLKFALGEPPLGCEIGLMMNEHELGNYPSVGVYWAFPASEPPYDYIRRADDLLYSFNKAVAWDQLYPLADDPAEDAENDSDDDGPFDNPSASSLTWHTYKAQRFCCKTCGWQGLGGELEFGEEFDQLVELNCPQCETKLSFVMYPTLADSRANWNSLSDEKKAQVQQIENARARFDALCLKTPAQLPDIPMPAFTLDWDLVDDMTLLRLGDQIIFSEPATYEGDERFVDVARILKQRYGAALRDLQPSEASETWLYGDSLSAEDRLARFRREIFE